VYIKHYREECSVFVMRACLMLRVVKEGFSDVVDIFNVTAGSWSTAVLSKARANLASTSLPSAGIAVFAGGNIGACFRSFFRCRNAGLCTSSTTERSALCL
jgi:hypothetical protein